MAGAFVRLTGSNGETFTMPRRAWQAFAKGTARLMNRLGADPHGALNAVEARVCGVYLRHALRLWGEGIPTWLMLRLGACREFCESPAVDDLVRFLLGSGGFEVLPLAQPTHLRRREVEG